MMMMVMSSKNEMNMITKNKITIKRMVMVVPPPPNGTYNNENMMTKNKINKRPLKE
jgi:hypothetical protein